MSFSSAARRLRAIVPSSATLRQGGWALVDQALSSGTNFGVAILVARFLGPADYGSFSFAYAAWITLMGISRSLLVQPFQITASGSDGDDWRAAARSGAGSSVLLGGAGGLVIAIVALVVGLDDPTGKTLLVMAVCAIPLVLQDFWRFAAFSRRDARAAAYNDGLWAFVQVAAFIGVAQVATFTAPVAFAAWAAGAVAGALFGMRQFRVVPTLSKRTTKWIKEVISLGGWFTLSNVFYSVGVQASLVIVGIFGGRADIGGLRSIVNLFGPAQLVRDASENVVLPQASRAHARGGRADVKRVVIAYSALVTIVMAAYGLLLVVFGSWVLETVFGPGFERFSSLMLPVAAATVMSASASGASVALRSTRAGKQLAGVQAALMAARVLITLVLIAPFGVEGAAWGQASVMGLSSLIMWRRFLTMPESQIEVPEPLAGTEAVT